MSSDHIHINEILALHFSGERLTDEQESLLIDWVYQHKEEYQRLSKLFQATKGSEFHIEQAWKKVDKETAMPKIFRLNSVWQVLSYAACIAVVCGIALYFLSTDKSHQSQYSNATATLLTVVLPDSSSVTLYPQAKISYIADAKRKERKTDLEGKAFFKVKPNAENPFIVHSNKTAVRVLGTSFLVDGEKHTKTGIFVREGVVQVSSEKEQVILKADEQAVSNGTAIVKSRIENPEQFFKEHIKQKTYKNVSLSQIIRDIEKEFNVQIICTESILNAKISTQLKFVHLEDILSEISYICNIQFRKTADKQFEFYKP